MSELPQSAPTPRAPIAAVRAIAVAERQWGVLSRAQLTECGLSGGLVSRWIESRRLQRLLPGVYALGHRALPIEGGLAAALLYAGPGAALSDATAVWWWELSTSRLHTTHVVSPCRRRSLDVVRVHHREAVERVLHRGIPVVPIEHALLHVARTGSAGRLLKALADA